VRNIAFDTPLQSEHASILCGAIHDVVGPNPSIRQQALCALAVDVLGPPSAAVDMVAFREHPLAEHAVVALLVAALLDRGDGPREALLAALDQVAAFTDAADADRTWVRIARLAASGWGTLATARLATRVPDGRYLLQRTWQREGVLGLVRTLGSPFGLTPGQAERAARFRAMWSLPEDSVGHTFVRRLSDVGIPLPGEPGGLQEGALHHDLMHVLTGYSTEPEGECRLAGLYAGFGYAGWPAWIVVTLLTFELGLRVGPTFTPPTVGAFDPEAVWAAALRARDARFHPLDADWNIDALWPMPLVQARIDLGFQ
jgi:hypothetical protein